MLDYLDGYIWEAKKVNKKRYWLIPVEHPEKFLGLYGNTNPYISEVEEANKEVEQIEDSIDQAIGFGIRRSITNLCKLILLYLGS